MSTRLLNKMLDFKDIKETGVIAPPMSVKAQKIWFNWATQRWLCVSFLPLHTIFVVVYFQLIL